MPIATDCPLWANTIQKSDVIILHETGNIKDKGVSGIYVPDSQPEGGRIAQSYHADVFIKIMNWTSFSRFRYVPQNAIRLQHWDERAFFLFFKKATAD